MRPPELAAIRPCLQQAVDDIDYFLSGLEEREKAEREWSELYDLIAAGETPPEVNGQGKPAELTPEQYAALEWRTADGQPITDEQREALLAGVLPGQPISDEGWAALQFALRGGWRESSRQAAVWLRNAGETVAADGINGALSRLPDEPRDATELSGYREAMRTAAEYVLTILTSCLACDGVVVDGRDNTIEQIRRGVEAFNDRQRQYEAGLERVSRAIQDVTPISGGDGESGDADGVPDSPSGFLGGVDLADALGVHPSRRDAFFQQLLRKRMSLGDEFWHEVTAPRPNSPRFLYRADSPTLRQLADSYKTPKPG